MKSSLENETDPRIGWKEKAAAVLQLYIIVAVYKVLSTVFGSVRLLLLAVTQERLTATDSLFRCRPETPHCRVSRAPTASWSRWWWPRKRRRGAKLQA